MVTRESLSLQDNFVSPLDVWPVESRHQEVEVCRQGLHDGHLGFHSAHDRSHHARGDGVGIQPCWEGRAFQRLEMALNPLRPPGREVLLYPRGRPLGLQTE